VDFDIRRIVLDLPAVLFSLTIHEFMHAWTAWKCGDDTALRQGRVSLNPLVHLDLLGTLCLFVGPVGWAKPVPVQRYNFNNPRRDDILVSGAGVAANLALAILLVVAARLMLSQGWVPQGEMGKAILGIIGWGIMNNFGLAMFNLLPFHPLDGSHVFSQLLPARAHIWFEDNRKMGMVALGILLLINWLVWPGFLYWPAIYLMVFLTGDAATSQLLDCMWPQ
jgi:Zn-dependent protease